MSSDFNYRGKIPFRVVSSSVNTGYNVELTQSIGKNIEIVNLHTDEYGGLENSPLQGPFTEKWVGGNQHRHIDLNKGTDSPNNRPEAFLISGSSGKIAVYGPNHFDLLRARAIYTRDTIAKSPLNIKNIKSRNLQVGNFNHNYEMVQTSGRSLNQSLIQNDLTASGVLTTKFISGLPDYQLSQNQDRTKSIIVERFSAPGDIKESSRGSLDKNGEEFAPNNSLITRNIGVRKVLYSQLTQHAEQFSGSIHGTNRNTIKNIELSGSTFLTSSDYDNFWIQHSIPSSDLRYKWIADSNTNTDLGSLLQYQTFAKGYNKSSAFTDITFNDSVFVKSGSNLQFEVDAAWLNSIVKGKKSIDAGTNTISVSSPSLSASFSEIANTLYGFSSWVQSKTNQHPVARALNNKNILSLEGNTVITSNNNTLFLRRSNNIVNFKEPPITGKFKPITQIAKLKDTEQQFKFIFTHENNKSTFTDNNILQKLGIDENSKQMYNVLLKYYTDPNISTNPQNPFSSLEKLNYSETIYPAESNTYLASTRGRTAYILTQSGTSRDGFDRQLGTQRVFWRDSLEDRKRSESGFINSLNYTINEPTQSAEIPVEGTGENINYPSISKISTDIDYTSILRVNSNYRQESILAFDNNQNNSYKELFEHVLFVTGSNIRKIIANKTIDNGCTGELNSEIFVDYFYSSGTVPGTFPSQLLRVTPFTNYLQFDYRSAPGNYEFSSSYFSYCNFIINPYNGKELYYTSYAPRPNYLAFLGGFEIGTRPDYTTGSDEFDLSQYQFFNNQPAGTIISSLDSGLRYDIGSFAGKKPWFDSYENYSADIRPLAKDHSILPEFNISKNMPYYVKTKSGNFRSTNNAFIELDGSDKNSYRSSTGEAAILDQKFVKSYILSDNLNNIQQIQQQIDNKNKLSQIKFTISGIKKLLPYNGFYPKDRTIQLANLFNEFLDNNVDGGYFKITKIYDGNTELYINTDKSSDYFYKHTVMPYFFAPGILYNTIKSGISVDFPCITSSFDSILNNILDNVIEEKAISVASTTRDFVLSGSTVRLSYLADGLINSRIPFEDLIFPQESIPLRVSGTITTTSTTTSLSTQEQLFNDLLKDTLINIKFDAYTSPDSFFEPTGTLNGLLGAGWKDSVPFAYLKTQKVIDPSYSMAMSNFLAEIPTFFLKQHNDGQHLNVFRSAEVGEWKTFNSGTNYYFDLILKKSNNLVMMESFNSSSNRITGSTSLEKTANGRYFGWPVNKTTASLNSASTINQYSVHNDPAYAPFTPPYFEGEAILRFKLKSSKTKYNSVKELQEEIQLENIFFDLSSSISTDSEAYKHKMSLKDCLEIFGVGRNKRVIYDTLGNPIQIEDILDASKEYWTISPKLETPVLDFSDQKKVSHTGSYWKSDGYGRGMWSGYGKIPDSSKGITLKIAESFPLRRQSEMTGSLLRQIGFRPEAKKIGQIASSKTISEAIVAIPFVDNPIPNKTVRIGNFNFFLIDKTTYNLQKRNVLKNNPAIQKDELGSAEQYEETSISKMIKLMNEYVIPPNFNFNTYNDIDPFVMYIFEFKHNLDQQDLADIWQSVMPKIAINAEQEVLEFGHKINKYEFFGEDFEIPENMRWLIFKVKKKAQANYFAITANQADDNRFQFYFANSDLKKTPEYSYNWPYDYFSLVEMAKIDISYTFEKRTETKIVAPEETATQVTSNNQFEQSNNVSISPTGIEPASRITTGKTRSLNISRARGKILR